jgi:hypothetical protein
MVELQPKPTNESCLKQSAGASGWLRRQEDSSRCPRGRLFAQRESHPDHSQLHLFILTKRVARRDGVSRTVAEKLASDQGQVGNHHGLRIETGFFVHLTQAGRAPRIPYTRDCQVRPERALFARKPHVRAFIFEFSLQRG